MSGDQNSSPAETFVKIIVKHKKQSGEVDSLEAVFKVWRHVQQMWQRRRSANQSYFPSIYPMMSLVPDRMPKPTYRSLQLDSCVSPKR